MSRNAKLAVALGLLASQTNASIEYEGKMIVGGEPAESGRYPWIAGLVDDQLTSTIFCGGTLIAENVVLSAAHCGIPYIVDVGCHVLGEECERAAVLATTIDPSFVERSNDFSIIQLLKPIVSVSPIRFLAGASMGEIPPETPVTVIGWGATQENGNRSTTLLEVGVPIVDQEVCQNAYARLGAEVDGSMICAGIEGKDSCLGDNGGPLFLRCDENLNDILVGVVSWGVGCARAEFPRVYAKVSSSSFIMSKLAELNVTLREPPAFEDVCQGTGVPVNAPSPVPAPVPIIVPTIHPEWICDIAYYAAADGCDCGCGSHDPDCDDPESLPYGCSSLDNCVNGVCLDAPPVPSEPPVPTIAPEVPESWTCYPFTYAQNDGCDCDCGSPDPDCDDPLQDLYNCDNEAYCVKGICSNQPGGNPMGPPASSWFMGAVAGLGLILFIIMSILVAVLVHRCNKTKE